VQRNLKKVKKLKKFKAKAKIIVSLFQINASFLEIFDDVDYPKSLRTAFHWMNVFNLDVVPLLSSGCVAHAGFHYKLVVATAAPLALGAALLGANRFSPLFRGQLFGAFLLLTFLILPGASVTIFSTWACDSNYETWHVLKADASVECDSRTHRLFELYATIMVFVYPLGIPAFYTAILYKSLTYIHPSVNLDGVEKGDISDEAKDAGGAPPAKAVAAPGLSATPALFRDARPSPTLELVIGDTDPGRAELATPTSPGPPRPGGTRGAAPRATPTELDVWSGRAGGANPGHL